MHIFIYLHNSNLLFHSSIQLYILLCDVHTEYVHTIIGELAPHQTGVIECIFEPNAQGQYKETLEIYIKSNNITEWTLVMSMTITGLGYSPKIDGLPAYIDFGNVPLGMHTLHTQTYSKIHLYICKHSLCANVYMYVCICMNIYVVLGMMAYAWIQVHNKGYVDDELHIYSQKPFLCVHNYIQVRAQAHAKLGIFFKPTKTCQVLKSISILAAGKVSYTYSLYAYVNMYFISYQFERADIDFKFNVCV